MVTKNLIIIAFALLLSSFENIVYSQTIGKRIYSLNDSTNYLIDITKINYYRAISIDNNLFEFFSDKKGRFIGSKNGIALDTLKDEKYRMVSASENCFFYNGNILMVSNSEEIGLGIWEFNASTNKFSLKFSGKNLWTLDFLNGEFWAHGHRGSLSDEKQLYKIDCKNYKLEKVVDLKPHVSEKSVIAEIYNFNSGSKLLIMTGEGNADGFDSTKFFVFDTKSVCRQAKLDFLLGSVCWFNKVS